MAGRLLPLITMAQFHNRLCPNCERTLPPMRVNTAHFHNQLCPNLTYTACPRVTLHFPKEVGGFDPILAKRQHCLKPTTQHLVPQITVPIIPKFRIHKIISPNKWDTKTTAYHQLQGFSILIAIAELSSRTVAKMIPSKAG